MPKAIVDRLTLGADNPGTELRERAYEFGQALKAGRTDRIYGLFNSSFREEIRPELLDSAVKAWLAGRAISRVMPSNIELYGPSGMVSSYVYFLRSPADSLLEEPPGRRSPRPNEFLFQYWLKTASGWQLIWLNKLLDPVAMDYGHGDTADVREILQLALDQIITARGLKKSLGITTSNRIVLLHHGGPEHRISLPDNRVVWLSKDSIATLTSRSDLDLYIDVLPLRVFKDIAIGTFDIIPLSKESGALSTRRRSVKLIFAKAEGKWGFANYGAQW